MQPSKNFASTLKLEFIEKEMSIRNIHTCGPFSTGVALKPN